MKTTSQVKKAKAKKNKKISITLPEREGEVLKVYAKELGITRPAAVKRIVRETLKQYKTAVAKAEPKNQLGLFDSLQVDIFNNTSKTSD